MYRKIEGPSLCPRRMGRCCVVVRTLVEQEGRQGNHL